MSKSPSRVWPNDKAFALPLILFMAALALRLIGIDWGLPDSRHQQSYHPDEPVVWMASQAIQPASLDFTPGFYNYGTLYLSTLKVASDVVAGYSGGGIDPQKPDEAWQYIARCHLAGRVISALAGSGMVLMVFFILRRVSTEFGAAFGALAIAFAPAHVVHSRFQTVDILAAFLLSVSALLAVKLLSQPRDTIGKEAWKHSLLSGAFAGLSAGTKYTGILCLATVVLIAMFHFGKRGIKLSVGAVGTAVAAFLLATPGILLESKEFWDGFSYETSHVRQGHGLIFEGTSNGFLFHFQNLMVGIGLFIVLVGLAGLLVASYRRQTWAIGILATLLLSYVVIGGAEVKFIRYTFPLYLGIAIGFGWAMARAREKGGWWHGVVAVGLLGLGGLPGGGLTHALRYTGWMNDKDPRDQAGELLAGQSTTVGIVSDPWFYTPSFHPPVGRRMFVGANGQVGMTPYIEPLHQSLSSLSNPSVARYIPVSADGVLSFGDRFDWDERLLTDSKPEFVVYSSFETEGLDRISRLSNPSDIGKLTVDRAKGFVARLKRDYDLHRVYGAGEGLIHDLMYIQPRITVWKRKSGR